MGVETVYLDTIDGIQIEADLVRTDAFPARAIVIIGHPHPLYGGDRFNPVVRAMQEAAASLACHSIAIDFRGVNNSGGVHDDGDSERLDLAAACELADMIEPECPIIMTGYSFGSMVALNVTNPWIAAWIAVAPPLPMMTSTPISAQNSRPKILIAPEHDQFTVPASLREATSNWTNTTVIELSNVDHFIAVGARDACHQALLSVVETL
ncbi:MAG: alpha/beta fold hydrolase [Actinomycetes bacterium]